MRIAGTRAFIALSIGQAISIFGTNLSGFALSVWVFEQNRSVTQFALLLSFMTLPAIVARPVAGALVDRWDRRLVLIGSDTIAALFTALTLLLVWAGQLSVGYVYLITLVQTITGAFQVPASAAAIQLLVPPEQFGRASAANGVIRSLPALVTPLITGALLALIGLEGILYIDLASFAAALGALALIRIPAVRRQAAGAATSLGQEIREGWRYIARRRGLALLAVLSLLVAGAFDTARVLLTPLVLSFATAEALGAILSAAAVGILLGNLIMLAWGGRRRRVPIMLACGALAGVGLALSGLRPSAPLIGAGAVLVMTSISIIWVCLDAVWLSKVPPDLLGRVKGTTTTLDAVVGTAVLLSVGLLADHVFEPLMAPGGALAPALGPLIGAGAGRGAALLLLLAGAAALLLSALALLDPRVRRLEETLPDVDPAAYVAEEAPALTGA